MEAVSAFQMMRTPTGSRASKWIRQVWRGRSGVEYLWSTITIRVSGGEHRLSGTHLTSDILKITCLLCVLNASRKKKLKTTQVQTQNVKMNDSSSGFPLESDSS